MVKHKQIDLSKIKLMKISKRKSKVTSSLISTRINSDSVLGFIDSLPDILKGKEFKLLINAIISAKKKKKPIIWMFGAHLIKVGLAPVLSEIIETGFASQISTNNAGLIHDLELAFFGKTSEDVEEALKEGQFGMTAETAEIYKKITDYADLENIGLGEAAGYIINSDAPGAKTSVFATAYRNQIPATVHVAIGADIVNCHPMFDGAVVGQASQIDFKIFCQTVTRIKNGGVALNIGSAVIMPEIFLKAMAIARNLDNKFSKFTTANFDMIRHYRPTNNIVSRPRILGAKSYDFAGHHEIMIPLLWAGVSEQIDHC